ncbi:MAG: hypothetical protein HY000_19005, partial [Planctomycetes bacterium]|nr:hypothetical protein [Planctomycetota bacterium]
MVAAALLFACLLPPVTPLAQTPPPSAEKVLSGLPELLPGFKLPWQVDPIVRRWKSEAEWKKAHPGLREQVQQLVTGLRRMSDPDWQRMRQETE